MSSTNECKYYSEFGACPYGTLCKYIHNYERATLFNISKQLDIIITMLNKIEQNSNPQQRGRSQWGRGQTRRASSASRITKALHNRGMISTQANPPSQPMSSEPDQSKDQLQGTSIDKTISEMSAELKNLEISRKRKILS